MMVSTVLEPKSLDEKWQRLFGGVEPLKLSTSPQPYSIERTIRWLTHQVANSLALSF